MLINKKTKHSIFSLPLIFGDILTKKELDESEFVNMYVRDLNSPLSTNHIFLVFHNIKNDLLEKLKAHTHFVSEYTLILDKIKYTVLSFQRAFSIGSIVKQIENGLYICLPYADKMKILEFWYGGKISSNLHQYLFNDKIRTEKPLSENITLSDENKRRI